MFYAIEREKGRWCWNYLRKEPDLLINGIKVMIKAKIRVLHGRSYTRSGAEYFFNQTNQILYVDWLSQKINGIQTFDAFYIFIIGIQGRY